MPSFKQKNVIRSYKLRLQEKLKTVTEETESSISFLNNCLLEFKNRVHHILEIKDEKCLSLYRQLIGDLENYSEKLFILQASLEDVSEEDTDSSENEESESKATSDHSVTPESRPVTDQSNSVPCSSSHAQSRAALSASDTNVKSKPKDTHEGDPYAVRNKNSNLENYCEGAPYPEKDAKSDFDSYAKSPSYPEKERKSELDSYCEGAAFIEKRVKTKLDEEVRGSITEDDFCSLQSDSVAQNIGSATVFLSSQLSRYDECNNENYESNQSFSHSSCYRSLSSNISEPLVLYKEALKSTQSSKTHLASNENESSLESESTNIIHPPDVKIPSTVFATLAHIVDPGNFWIQIENSCDNKIKFSKFEDSHLNCFSSIEEGCYCLAPFKTTPFFYRALSLSNAKSGKEKVKVHFIDHGSTQEIPLRDLRSLPSSAYDIPVQALHCFLDGVAPINGSWSDECIEKFKDFRDYHSIETAIKSKESLYAVQLTANSSEDLKEDLSVDVALYLCLEGLAISENESFSRSMDLNHIYDMQPSKPATTNINLIEVPDMTAISSDSGVSVTSAYKSNNNSTSAKQNFDKIENASGRDCDRNSVLPLVNISTDSCDKKFDFTNDTQAPNPFSFERYNTLDLRNSNEITKFTNNSKSICPICRRDNFCLHLKIPLPRLVYVEKDMMIVMLSHVETPHEFYVNMAMENIVNLDELREQMTTTYESQRKDFPSVKMTDLYENMFCAGYYDVDGYWYRVKIMQINSEKKKQGSVTVQYIDYGNRATIQCSNLQPLVPQFSQHPAFAIQCSLAGIVPVQDSPAPVHSSSPSVWSEDSVGAFKEITGCDRCLTAQICNELRSQNNDILPVLLWDTEDSNDRLINFVLADLGVAKFDEALSHIMPSVKEIPNPSSDILNPSNVTDVDMLNAWDPMSEEYNDIENSYGVNDEDIQVITSGYQARDEEYTCKYFSLRGYCPRGASCPYEHHTLLESGVTRDQEEVYCLDTLPIIPDTTDNIIVNVSAIINPCHFYIVLPYGCKTVEDINSLVNGGCAHEDILNNEAKVLFYAVNKHYSNAPFQESTTVALACGTIVAAKRSWDKHWHRGRVVDVSDIRGPAKIFFVDSGDSEWVPHKFIRTILPQFLYTPFQAVQCSLKGVEPIGSKDERWLSDAINLFKKAVEGEALLAENIHRLGDVFHLTLRRTTKDNHQYIGHLLVSAGLAQCCADVPSQKKESLYVPG